MGQARMVVRICYCIRRAVPEAGPSARRFRLPSLVNDICAILETAGEMRVRLWPPSWRVAVGLS